MSEKPGKTRTSVYIDDDLAEAAKRLGLSPSKILNDAYREICANENMTLAEARGRVGAWQGIVNKLETEKAKKNDVS